jgi:hypothetical protein
MCYNPKGKKLADILAKDVNKNAIKAIGKKHSAQKMAPFFIKTDFAYADKQVAPLFIFGKIKSFKQETSKLKGATELHGLCYVSYDDKNVSTLCLAPNKGKLKEAELKKAMKVAFTSSFANFKLLDAVSDDALLAAENATEALADEAEDVDSVSAEKETDAPAPNTPDTATADKKAAEVSQKVNAWRAEIKKITEALDDDESPTKEQQARIDQLDKGIRTLLVQFANSPEGKACSPEYKKTLNVEQIQAQIAKAKAQKEAENKPIGGVNGNPLDAQPAAKFNPNDPSVPTEVKVFMQDAATNVAALVGGKGSTKERFDMELSLNLQVEEFVKRGTNLQAYPEVQKLVNDFTAYKKAAIAKVKKLNLAVYVQSMDRTWGIGGVSKEDIAKLTSWIKDVEKVRSITPCFFNEDAKFSQYLALLKRMEYTVPAADAALKRFSF